MEDKYLWLEDILSKKSMEWVKAENKSMEDAFQDDPNFEKLTNELQEILESKEKIPFIQFIDNGFVYNTWTDETHVQGLVRRTTVDEYKKPQPQWDVLINLDVLSKKDAQKWVFHGMLISPGKSRALVYLSPGGGDADVVREFDLITKTFVENGFELPLAKGSAEWLSDDELLVFRDFGPGTVTSAGYARTVRKWIRGDIHPNENPIFEIPFDDNGIFMESFHDGEKSQYIAYENIDFYHKKIFSYADGKFTELNLPSMCEVFGIKFECLYLTLKENWKNFLTGDVLVYDLGKKTGELIYRPAKNSSLYEARIIKDGVLLVLDIDVKSSLLFAAKKGSNWETEKIDLPANGNIGNLVSDPNSNEFFISYDSFNTPMTYFYGVKNKIEAMVKKSPVFFDYESIEIHQHFVKSLDGTMVPYFLAHKKGMKFDGKNPTILYGYGGFEITLKARFNNILGKAWLEKGGVYVLSNIRGGGEYGPLWHQCALKENRDRAYQDFFAIAEDLIAKKITSPSHLGAQGGSNGGLLMGVCFTQRPELFAAINCGVPLLDMRRYHTLLAGHSWVAEYGDPDDPLDGEYIRALSPYHRIDQEQKQYPMIFLNTSTKDDRVHPGHARKFAAKLKEYGLPYWYHENINGGHSGASNLKELAFMVSLDYAFFWKYLK
jgi:prolyl oligopeptidase